MWKKSICSVWMRAEPHFVKNFFIATIYFDIKFVYSL